METRAQSVTGYTQIDYYPESDTLDAYSETDLDEYLAEHTEGDIVTGRIVDVSGGTGRVKLGEGVHATCQMDALPPTAKKAAEPVPAGKADLSSLGSMLQAHWLHSPTGTVVQCWQWFRPNCGFNSAPRRRARRVRAAVAREVMDGEPC